MKKGSARGFTLIEMLVAMAIFASLIVVLLMGYHQGLMMWDKGQHMSRRWLDLEFRYHLLDTMFAQAEVADDEFAKDVSAPFFNGDKDSMQLISSAPLMDDIGRIRPVMLQWSAREDGLLDLRYQEGKRHSDQRRGIRWSGQWVILLHAVSHVSFRYELPENPLPEALMGFRLSKQDRAMYRDHPEWKSSCQSRELLRYPRRVALYFTDANGVAHQWFFRPPDRSDAWIMG